MLYRVQASFLRNARAGRQEANCSGLRFIDAFILLWGLLGALGSASAATTPQPNMFYTLTNLFLKEGRPLAVKNGQLVMANKPAANETGHLWKFTPVAGQPGYYRITNLQLGDGKSIDSSPTAPNIANSGLYQGQLWRLTDAGNGYVRLSNMYQPAKSLDTAGNAPNMPFLNVTGNYSGQLWKLTLANVPVTSNAPNLNVAPSGTLQLSTGPALTITGPDGKPVVLKPGNQTVQTFTTVNPSGGQLIVQEGQQLGGPTTQLTVGGCVAQPTLPACQPPRPATTPDAAKGAVDFPPPGLGAFLTHGGATLLEKIYGRPDVVLSFLAEPFKNAEGNPPLNGLPNMCAEPVANDAASALMFAMLLDAVAKPKSARSKEEQAFVALVENFMTERRRFIAQRAQYIYLKWRTLEGSKVSATQPKSALQGVFDLTYAEDPAPVFQDVLDGTALPEELMAHVDAYLAAITHQPVVEKLAPNVATVAKWSSRYSARNPRLLKSKYSQGTGAHRYNSDNLGGFVVYPKISAGAFSGPRRDASIEVISLLLNWWVEYQTRPTDAAMRRANWWNAFDTAVSRSVAAANTRVQLDDLKDYEDGPLQMAFYWALAVGAGSPTAEPGKYPGAVVYGSGGNPASRRNACRGISVYSGNVPAALATGYLTQGGAVSGTNIWQCRNVGSKTSCSGQKFARPYNAEEVLAASGLPGVPGVSMRVSLGDAAYRAAAVASVLKNDRVKIAEYLNQLEAAKPTSTAGVDPYKAQAGALTLLNCSGSTVRVLTYNSNDTAMMFAAGETTLRDGVKNQPRCGSSRQCKLRITGVVPTAAAVTAPGVAVVTNVTTGALSGYQVFVKGKVKATNEAAMKVGCSVYYQ